MSKIVKEVMAVTGKYTNAQGEQKNQYTVVGKIIQTAKGEMLKIDALPVGCPEWTGWCYLNDPKPKDWQPQPLEQRHETQAPGFAKPQTAGVNPPVQHPSFAGAPAFDDEDIPF